MRHIIYVTSISVSRLTPLPEVVSRIVSNYRPIFLAIVMCSGTEVCASALADESISYLVCLSTDKLLHIDHHERWHELHYRHGRAVHR